jgi:DNA polymerase III delta prime subunit
MALGPPSNDSWEGKLILFHGPPGCGKTFAIRALLRSWCEWCAPELLIDPESAFGETRYLIQLLRSTAHQEPNQLSGSGESSLLKTLTSIWGLTQGQATIRRWIASSTSQMVSLARDLASSTC